MELDLGSRPSANVTVGADVYKMSVPSVKQSLIFNNKLNGCPDDLARTEAFIEFVSELGMPSNIVEGLSTQQLTKLAEGLLGNSEKK